MGITIHYSGHLTDLKRLPELVTAVQSACLALDWPYEVVDERVLGTMEILTHHAEAEDEDEQWVFEERPVDDRWRGIVVQPPGSEPVWLTFNRSAQMISYGASPESYTTPGHYFAQDLLFTKTQFASPDVHMGVCNLLRLAQAHGAEIDVTDESGYWESGDRQELEQRLKSLGAIIDSFAQTLSDASETGDDEGLRVEVGKHIQSPFPDWRRDWGISANEN